MKLRTGELQKKRQKKSFEICTFTTTNIQNLRLIFIRHYNALICQILLNRVSHSSHLTAGGLNHLKKTGMCEVCTLELQIYVQLFRQVMCRTVLIYNNASEQRLSQTPLCPQLTWAVSSSPPSACVRRPLSAAGPVRCSYLDTGPQTDAGSSHWTSRMWLEGRGSISGGTMHGILRREQSDTTDTASLKGERVNTISVRRMHSRFICP